MKIWFIKGVWTSHKAKDKLKKLAFEDVKSIAIIRHAALGDMILTRSFIIEAKKLFPNSKITISVVSNYTRGIPEDLVDRVHVIHGNDQRDTPLRTRIKKIRELGYHDLIFDLAGGNRSLLTCFFTPALVKFGFPYRRFRAWLFYDVTTCRTDLNFEVNDMLSMLHVIGAKTAYPHVYDMPGKVTQRNRPYMVYFTGASGPEKCWPQANFAELIKQMSTHFPDIDHLILDGLKDWERADKIISLIGEVKNISAVTADTVEETTSLMKGARLLVSNDTGIRHVAIACDTPTVGIFEGGPYRYWPRYDIHDAAFPRVEGATVAIDEVKQACIGLLEQNR